MFRKWFFNMRNAFIIVFGLALTGFFYIRFGNIDKPLVFVCVVLASSILHSVLSSDKNLRSASDYDKNAVNADKLNSIEEIVESIYKSIKSIKSKSRYEKKFTLISRFMEELDQFENVVPELFRNYKEGMDFVNKSASLRDEIKKIELKIGSTKGAARKIYEKALNEKLLAVAEIESIKESLDESESELHYILSILQKMEAIMESSELDEALDDEVAESLNTNLEAFSDGLKGIIKSMRL